MPATGNCQQCRRPNECCRYAVHRMGAMIIAVMYMVINLGHVLGYGLYLLYFGIGYTDERSKILDFMVLPGLGALILGGTNVTFDSLLLHGARKMTRKLVLVWLIWYGIFTSVVSVGWFVGFVVWIYLTVTVSPSSLALGVYFTCIHCLLGLFVLPAMWFCHSRVSAFLTLLAPNEDKTLNSKLARQNTHFALVNLPAREDVEDDE